MDISDIVSAEYEQLGPDDRVSKLVGIFDDPGIKGVVVEGDRFEGIVTRRQLATSHHPPDEKLGSLVWHVPHLAPDEDVRRVAQLMIDSDVRVLPVFEGGDLVGVVTDEDVLRAVKPYLDAATVAEACSRDLVTVSPDDTFGQALHHFREHNITHLPVVTGSEVVGILSLYDVVDVTTRPGDQPKGGDVSGTDSFGGQLSQSAGRARRGGFGAREGERTRILDLPIRDVMVSPVRTIHPEETLEMAVEAMFDIEASSLVVTENGEAYGILTKTDVLDSLTWEAPGNRAVQVYGADLLDDVTYDEVVAMVEKFEGMDADATVLDAKVHLHEHTEKHRGVSLLLARIRLYTDRGLFIASGEGYGASHALNEARDVLERQLRDAKTYGHSKKPPSEEYWTKRFGWLLEE